MLGIDLVKIKRFENNHRISRMILSSDEMDSFVSSQDKTTFLATHFAVKEAFLKAKGVGIFEIPFKDIVLKKTIAGKPYIVYDNKEDFEVSISHDGEYVVAVVLGKE